MLTLLLHDHKLGGTGWFPSQHAGSTWWEERQQKATRRHPCTETHVRLVSILELGWSSKDSEFHIGSTFFPLVRLHTKSTQRREQMQIHPRQHEGCVAKLRSSNWTLEVKHSNDPAAGLDWEQNSALATTGRTTDGGGARAIVTYPGPTTDERGGRDCNPPRTYDRREGGARL